MRNTSDTWERVTVTGDLQDGILPLFGPNETALKPSPDNAFDLTPSGITGDTQMGWLGLSFLDPTTGNKRTTITFRARALTLPTLPTGIGFEYPSLGQLCRFSDADPLRDRYLQSHGVAFSGDSSTALGGLAVLHECSDLQILSHTTGDYFLAGRVDATMANGGVPWLPTVINFSHPVSEASLYACKCGSFYGSYTLFLQGYDGRDATGAEIASDSRPATVDWQLWKVTAPAGKAFRSVKLSETGDPHTLVVDDLQWSWAPE